MTAQWKIEPVPALSGYTIEWLEPGRILLSQRNRIYRASTPTGPRELVGEVAAPLWKRWASRVRGAQRLLRFMAYNVLPLPDDTALVTFDRQVGILSNGEYRDLPGMSRPCRVLRRGCALTSDASVVWGEYVKNKQRGAIEVYRYRPGETQAQVVHTFSAGEIRHVHGIYPDPYADSLWCLTGDWPSECKILRTNDAFETLETVGEGDETWRSVSLLCRPEAVYYASDAEFRGNYIYRLDRRTGRRTTLASIDGPVYYSHAIGEDLLFATTAELCPSQSEPVASLWHVTPTDEVTRVFSFTKDLFRKHLTAMLFMPGTFHFPLGPGLDGETYLSGVGLHGVDNLTLRLSRGEAQLGISKG